MELFQGFGKAVTADQASGGVQGRQQLAKCAKRIGSVEELAIDTERGRHGSESSGRPIIPRMI